MIEQTFPWTTPLKRTKRGEGTDARRQSWQAIPSMMICFCPTVRIIFYFFGPTDGSTNKMKARNHISFTPGLQGPQNTSASNCHENHIYLSSLNH